MTYESSDKTVATVDSATGKVTILKAGSTDITATAAETADYEQATATYTLTVGKKTVTVKAKDQTAYVGDKAPVRGTDSCTVSGLVGEEKLTTQPTVKYVGADGSEITPDMTKTCEVKILAGGVGQGARHHRRHRRWAVRLRQRLHESADRGVPVADVRGKGRSRPLIRIFPGRKAGGGISVTERCETFRYCHVWGVCGKPGHVPNERLAGHVTRRRGGNKHGHRQSQRAYRRLMRS